MAGTPKYTDYKNFRAYTESFHPYLLAMCGIILLTLIGYGMQNIIGKANASDIPSFSRCNNLANQTFSMNINDCSQVKIRPKAVYQFEPAITKQDPQS